jgi:hypothetical protein
MKIIQKIGILSLFLGMLFSVSSCFVLLDTKKDNGQHRGHHKKEKKRSKPFIIHKHKQKGHKGNHKHNG